MIEEAVVHRVLGDGPAHRRRLRRGVRRGQALVVGRARRRQGRGAHVGPRPRRRHPGRGRATPPASPTPPTCPRPGCWPRPRRPPRRPAAAAAARTRGRSPAVGAPRPPVAHPARTTVRQGDARSSCCSRADEAARAAGGVDHARCRASYGDSRRRILVANSDGLLAERRPGAHAASRCRAWPPATPACRPGASRSATPSASSCSTATTSRSWPREAAAPGPHQARGPARAERRDAGRHRLGRRRRAVPRGVRPRPRGRPASARARRCSRAASASRWPARWSPSSTTARWASEWGALRHRRRGPPGPAQRADRGRRPHRLHVGLPAGPQGGPRPRRATAGARATSTCRWCA